MDPKNFVKLTYHLSQTKKINVYESTEKLSLNIEKHISHIFRDQLQEREFQIYWIDEDGDKITVKNVTGFTAFVETNSKQLHLNVEPLTEAVCECTSQHRGITCDLCKIKPIVGYRYKCLQCHNYDLCENCDSKHIHPEHLMLRIPMCLKEADELSSVMKKLNL